MSHKGMLLVMMQPPYHLEEEYNDWYDTEHLLDRLSAPGFETGKRYVSSSSGPRTYLAIYDLTDIHVMETPEYRKLSGTSFTPWTKRLMRRMRRYRALTEQVSPGDAVSQPCSSLLLVRFSGLLAADAGAVVDGVEVSFAREKLTLQHRVFAEERDGGVNYFAMVGSSAPLENRMGAETFGKRIAGSIDLAMSFMPYRVGMTWERSIEQD
jgi:hypothetical protein